MCRPAGTLILQGTAGVRTTVYLAHHTLSFLMGWLVDGGSSSAQAVCLHMQYRLMCALDVQHIVAACHFALLLCHVCVQNDN